MQEATPIFHDIWGRPIKKTMGLLETVLGPTQPEVTFLDREVSRLTQKTKPDGSALLAIGSVKDKIENVDLTDAQYQKYVERAGELARLRATQIVSRSRWDRLSDEAQAGAIRDAVDDARDRAKSELLRQDTKLKKDIRAQGQEERRRYRTPRAPGKALEAVRRRNQ